MSIAGIASSLFSQISNLQGNNKGTLHTEFQQLAQDLQAGNLSQAQSDFAAIEKSLPASQSSGSSLQQAFSALGTDLQSGNVSAAQQDFATIQQDFQQAQIGGMHHHHHHHSAATTNSANSSQDSILQLFATLGQDLQSGNLTTAQQAYTALQQDLPWLAASPSASAPVNLTA